MGPLAGKIMAIDAEYSNRLNTIKKSYLGPWQAKVTPNLKSRPNLKSQNFKKPNSS